MPPLHGPIGIVASYIKMNDDVKQAVLNLLSDNALKDM